MPDLNHLWQRFLLASALLVGLALGAAVTVFGYSNLGSVNVHWSVFHIDGVPLWAVAVVPLALVLIAGTIYHWMDGLHHFTEHMRHRRRVHELEAEVTSLRAHLDHILEMPDHSGSKLPAKSASPTSLPAADEAMAALHGDDADIAPVEAEPAKTESIAKVDGLPTTAAGPSEGRPTEKAPTTPKGTHRGLRRRATLAVSAEKAEPPVSPAPEA